MSARTDRESPVQGVIVGELPTCCHPRPARAASRHGEGDPRAFSRRSAAFFKREAATQRVPYQRLIRALVDEYTRRMG